MNKRIITKKTRNRILAAVMSLALLLTTVPGIATNANAESSDPNENDRRADGSTVNSYHSFLDAGSTLDAGRIWTDKSVYNLYDGADYSNILGVNVADMTSDTKADFLEVFSALGSSAAVKGAIPVMDVMFVLDMSGSMGYLPNGTTTHETGVAGTYTETRLYNAVEALNSAFDYVQEQNELNRVGLTIYSGEGPFDSDYWLGYIGQEKTDASNGLVVLGLGQYTTGTIKDGKKEYFTVYGKGNPKSSNEIGAVGQVYMSVNVEGPTKIDDIYGHDKNAVGKEGYKTEYPLIEKIRAVGATNTQMGLYTAMSEMANEQKTTVTVDGEAVTRLPVVILLTDGIPTISETAEKWWEWGPDDDRDGVQGIGLEPYAYGNYMLAMATASYMKREINENYFGVSNPDGDKSAQVFTFGIDITDDTEAEIAEAFLNPKEFFESEFDTSVTYNGNNAWQPELIKKAWEEYQEKGYVNVLVEELGGDAVRPGGKANIPISWTNDNKVNDTPQPSNIRIELTLDGNLTVVDPVNDVSDNGTYDKGTNTVTWTINAKASEYGTVYVTVKASDNIALGDTLQSSLKTYTPYGDYGPYSRNTVVVDYDEYGRLSENARNLQIELSDNKYFNYDDYWYALKSPEKQEIDNIDDIDTLVYNDAYWPVSSSGLEDALREALESFHKIPVPIEGTNELAKDDMLSYYDPIGEYMEIKVNDDGLLGKLSLFDKTYNVVEDGEDSYKVVDSEGDGDDEIHNLSYGNDSDVTFKLSDIKIWVENKTDGNREYQVLRVDIPAAALPTLISTVELGFNPVISKDEAKIVVEAYATNADKIAPLRLFYTVGMQDEKLKEDGSINLNEISPEYRAQHLDPETGRVSFYSNLYSSNDYEYIGGAVSERGDAYTTFSPADTNRYYIYQEYLPLYTNKDNKESSYVRT